MGLSGHIENNTNFILLESIINNRDKRKDKKNEYYIIRFYIVVSLAIKNTLNKITTTYKYFMYVCINHLCIGVLDYGNVSIQWLLVQQLLEK